MNVQGVINHIVLATQLNLGIEYVLISVELAALMEKLQQGEHQMVVQIRSYPIRQIVARHHSHTFSTAYSHKTITSQTI